MAHEYNAQLINQRLTTKETAEFHIFNQVTSTNTVAEALLNNAFMALPQVVIADEQTAAYGNRGRSFYAPKQTGVYLSILMPGVNGANSGLLTMMVAVKVTTALKRLWSQLDFKLKWVNDLLLHDKKIGGILVQNSNRYEQGGIIIGIGLNIAIDQVPAELAHKIGAITTSADFDRNQIVAALLDELLQALKHPEVSFLNDYLGLCQTINQMVTLQVGNKEVTGRAIGINQLGHLFINSEQVTRAYFAGEVVKSRLISTNYRG